MSERSRTKSVALSAMAGLSLFAVASAAQAGHVLRFRSGAVATKEADHFHAAALFQASAAAGPRCYVVQYRTRVLRAQHKHLASLGAKVFRYLPDDALIIEASPPAIETLFKKTPGVRTVLPLRAQWKLSGDLGTASVFTADQRDQVLVRLFDAAKLASLVSAIEASGGTVRIARGRSIIAVLSRAQVERVSAVEGVEWMQPAPQMELAYFQFDEDGDPRAPQPAPSPPDGDYTDLTGYESGTKIMGFEAAYARGYTGRGQKVGFADTGFDRGAGEEAHADLKGRVSGNAFGMFALGWEDPIGHGTHVGGSIGGDGSASGGRIVGAAPDVSLIAQGMWSPLAGSLTVPPVLADMTDPAYAEGARVHSNSWGSLRDPGVYEAFAAQADEIMFNRPDLLLVFSAGNSGADQDRDGRIDPTSVTSPGTAKNVMTVGASENVVKKGGIQAKLGQLGGGKERWGQAPLVDDELSDDAAGMAAFSSRGPTADGRVKPDVVAPGTNVLSTRSYHPDAEDMWGHYSKDYVYSGGTSMSTPLVAGAAALVRQYLIEGRGLNEPSASLVKNILMHSSVDLFPGQFGAVGRDAGQELLTRRPNSDEGWGRVDAARATGLDHSLLFDEKTGVATEETMKFPLRVERAGKATLSLVWTDAPATPSAEITLVNDLDLALVDASGHEFVSRDRVNNFELIERNLLAGDYEVIVKGANVPHGKAGKQPFSLVITLEQETAD